MAITFSKTWPNQLPEKLKLHITPRTGMSTRTVVLHTFDVGDVERHEAVKEILAIYGDS